MGRVRMGWGGVCVWVIFVPAWHTAPRTMGCFWAALSKFSGNKDICAN